MPALALAAAPPDPFGEVEPGLEVAVLDAPRKSTHGDSRISAIRVDPVRRRLRLFSAKALALPKSLDALEWARLFSLPAVINAGMFELSDGRSTTGYGRVGGQVLNARWNPGANFQAVLVFDPSEPGLPPVRILDTLCGDPKPAMARYRVALQSIRMIDCRGQNHWNQRQRKWSAALVGLDGRGRVLLLHARSPWTPTEFIDVLLSIPALGLSQAIYMEGGPEASLVLNTQRESWTRVGSYETDFNENDDNGHLWAIPNVIGVEPLALQETPGARVIPPKGDSGR